MIGARYGWLTNRSLCGRKLNDKLECVLSDRLVFTLPKRHDSLRQLEHGLHF
jgi:hypothetical protein